jgi:hypothetical protein
LGDNNWLFIVHKGTCTNHFFRIRLLFMQHLDSN